MRTYTLKKIIGENDGSINSLAFSQDGSLFASGAGDGLITIFQGNGSGWEIHRFRVKAPVTTLLWHSLFEYAVLAGDASGYVHIINISKESITSDPTLGDRTSAPNSVILPGPIHCMAQNGFKLLAIGCRNFVELIRKETIVTWERVARLPDPPGFLELEGELEEPLAHSLQFLQDSEDVLLVTYLEHGMIAWDLKTYEIIWRIRPHSSKIGCSALSPDGKTIAVMNLHNGIDWYALPASAESSMGALFLGTTNLPTLENIILPVTFIYGGSAVLSGTSYGCARITDVVDWDLIGTLLHDTEDIVQAVGYSCNHGIHQMLTGIAERDGSRPIIHYWIQDEELERRAESGAQVEMNQLRVRASQMWVLAMIAISLVLGLATLSFITFWISDIIDLPYYYSRLWPAIKTLPFQTLVAA